MQINSPLHNIVIDRQEGCVMVGGGGGVARMFFAFSYILQYVMVEGGMGLLLSLKHRMMVHIIKVSVSFRGGGG